MTTTPRPNLAVLIDAENARAAHVHAAMARIEQLGRPIFLRAYGNWTNQQLAPWKKVLGAYAIKPAQHFRHCPGKNTSDIALVIDAMDLIHGGTVDGICIVSSDSDFIALACRIRESGLMVYGFGGRAIVPGLAAACDEYLDLFDELAAAPQESSESQA